MPSLKQIEANRRNSLKSTGPTSAAGKAASSMNALKSGIHAKSLLIPGEKADQLQSLIDDYYAHHRPNSPELRALLDDLISCEWLLRRLNAVEAQMWHYQLSDLWDKDRQQHPEGKVATNNQKAFATMQRRLDSTRRARDRALQSLRDHVTNPIPTPSDPCTTPASPSPENTSPQIGFVPPTLCPSPQPAPDRPDTPIGGSGTGRQSDILGFQTSKTLKPWQK